MHKGIESLGGNVFHAATNDDALARLSEHEFSHVVTDIGRPKIDGPNAGLLLLERMREARIKTPVIVMSRNADFHRLAALKLGAILVTDSPAQAMVVLLGVVRPR